MTFNEYLQYCPETGVITWIKPRRKIKVGQIAGAINNNGYLQIKFNGKAYKAHRLAWYLHYGVWPTNHIDHINGIKTDNRIINLRDVTRSENMNNTQGHREKTVKYYTFNKFKQKWQVQASVNGKLKYLGYFETEEKALQFVENNVHLLKGVV
jgi:hypothetical protein